jgi:hypothetical protein
MPDVDPAWMNGEEPELRAWIRTNVTFIGKTGASHTLTMFLHGEEEYHLGGHWPFLDEDELYHRARLTD